MPVVTRASGRARRCARPASPFPTLRVQVCPNQTDLCSATDEPIANQDFLDDTTYGDGMAFHADTDSEHDLIAITNFNSEDEDDMLFSSGASNDGIASSAIHALPPELRNAIYRYVLLGDARIDIGTAYGRPPQPGLLQADRQIRREATGIYYAENLFSFHIQDCDASVYIQWCSSSERRRDSEMAFCAECFRSPLSLHNLLRWVKAWYDHDINCVPGFGDQNTLGQPDPGHALAHLFVLLYRQRLDHNQVSWEQIKAYVEAVHASWAAIDPGCAESQ
ncbi:hypothetical protein LTR22_005880 [Elasticomyces elasticus]|nr:hypothetical protein LTR22_005880 [Elasticomyces elasticus]KAK4929121.1 hypothetical protein LTR49_004318 [Elasticomyces elasticus]KAK5766500.1 hypothetical protein LTS12_003417 [Elasticomyces elasticus]